MKKKQTALEWYIKEKSMLSYIPGPNYEKSRELIEKSKQMEREQIIDAFSEGTKMIDINDELSARFNACVYYVEQYEN
jgi:hypothetical protein